MERGCDILKCRYYCDFDKMITFERGRYDEIRHALSYGGRLSGR